MALGANAELICGARAKIVGPNRFSSLDHIASYRSEASEKLLFEVTGNVGVQEPL